MFSTTSTTCIYIVVLIIGTKYVSSTCYRANGGPCCDGYIWDENLKDCKRCPVGYIGNNCAGVCRAPGYGIDCQKHCDCDRKYCDPGNGCIDRSVFGDCKVGFFGRDCIFPCPYPTFGKKCMDLCDCEKNTCHYVLGCLYQGFNNSITLDRTNNSFPFGTNQSEINSPGLVAAVICLSIGMFLIFLIAVTYFGRKLSNRTKKRSPVPIVQYHQNRENELRLNNSTSLQPSRENEYAVINDTKNKGCQYMFIIEKDNIDPYIRPDPRQRRSEERLESRNSYVSLICDEPKFE
ncbi:multiple epidermal growth factor-like domains protein 10 [Saccostrea cucullata]|uniref:multiple epidermal growth factor-like domains protein 10 n=1 Tax=Saccostrea cuccullata TaxID=36930 RepID=UPI002ED2B67A